MRLGWRKKNKDADDVADEVEETDDDVEETDDEAEDAEEAADVDESDDADDAGDEDHDSGEVRIEKVVTSGVFSLDDEDHDVENNVWLIGDDEEVVVIDAAHDAEAILDAVGDREVLAVICTHAHNDHVNAALEVAERDEAPIALHPRDRRLWEMTHEDDVWDIDMEDGGLFEVGGTQLKVLHTPGHSPGSVCLYVEEFKVVFTGDTLFQGGPGATGRSFSDFPTILNSISDKLFPLPKKTRVLPGHGEETTIGAEEKDYDAWVERGH